MKLSALITKGMAFASTCFALMATLSSCQWENSQLTSLHVSVGYQSEHARFASRASINTVYPSIGTIWLTIETPTLTVAKINEQYNNGQLTLNGEKSAIKITDTDVSLNVPTDETLTVSIEAFNVASLKVFSGSTQVSPENLRGASVQVSVPIQADIDDSVEILTIGSQCPDSDDDGFCDVFEDLFVNALGVADIDGDGWVNSEDSDSDNDGINDQDDHNPSTLSHGEFGYTISNNGFPMFLVSNRAPIVGDISISLKGAIQHDIPLPLSATVDADVNDVISYEIVDPGTENATISISNNVLRYSILQGLFNTVNDVLEIRATDLGGASTTFKVRVTLSPSELLPIL